MDDSGGPYYTIIFSDGAQSLSPRNRALPPVPTVTVKGIYPGTSCSAPLRRACAAPRRLALVHNHTPRAPQLTPRSPPLSPRSPPPNCHSHHEHRLLGLSHPPPEQGPLDQADAQALHQRERHQPGPQPGRAGRVARQRRPRREVQPPDGALSSVLVSMWSGEANGETCPLGVRGQAAPLSSSYRCMAVRAEAAVLFFAGGVRSVAVLNQRFRLPLRRSRRRRSRT